MADPADGRAFLRVAAVLLSLALISVSSPAFAQKEEELPEGSEPESKPAAQTSTASGAHLEPARKKESSNAASAATADAGDRVQIVRPQFSETIAGPRSGWDFDFHGYARMPLRVQGLSKPRPPYLVDDNYSVSGFAYTRINETEYAELFLGIEHGRTRVVLGLLASGFSDWSETTLQSQQGVATAFVEHTWKELLPEFDLGVRAGMFWDRYGYSPQYDTYVLGRLHVAGARLHLRLWDTLYLTTGLGAHADLINANQGFTPAAWLSTGVDLGFVDASFFVASSWTKDTRQFSLIQNGSLTVFGGELRLAIPQVGPLWGSIARYVARSAQFTAPALEVLHSAGGYGLTQNFLGPDSDHGTGELLVTGFGLTWEPWRAATALFGPSGRLIHGLNVNLFGMIAWVASNQASDIPTSNFNDRVWIKWGLEPFFRSASEDWSWFFLSLRFDRVILDKNHDSLSFRVVTPKIGVTPVKDWNLDVFLSYSKYSYGDSVRLRPNQIAGDVSATMPDSDVIKLQAQAFW